MQSKKYALSPELYQGHGADLFLFLAQCIKDTIVSLGDDPSPPKPHHLGFTFSFPCDQTALDAGRLVWWTKGFTWSVDHLCLGKTFSKEIRHAAHSLHWF